MEIQERYPCGQGAGWRRSGEQTRTSVTRYPADEESRNTQAVTRGRGETWSTQAPEKRESAPKGKVQSVTDAKFPVSCWNRGSAGGDTATEWEVEILKGRRIVSNELENKRRTRENIGDENGRREGERKKAPSTGLVKETIPARAEKVDVRAPRESGGEDNAQILVLLDQGQGNAAEVYTAGATYFGHDRLWPTLFPTLAPTYFDHDPFWPRPILATVSPTLATVSFGIFEAEEGDRGGRRERRGMGEWAK